MEYGRHYKKNQLYLNLLYPTQWTVHKRGEDRESAGKVEWVEMSVRIVICSRRIVAGVKEKVYKL